MSVTGEPHFRIWTNASEGGREKPKVDRSDRMRAKGSQTRTFARGVRGGSSVMRDTSSDPAPPFLQVSGLRCGSTPGVYGVRMAPGDNPNEFAGLAGLRSPAHREMTPDCLGDGTNLEKVPDRTATSVGLAPVQIAPALMCSQCWGVFVDLGPLGTYRAVLDA